MNNRDTMPEDNSKAYQEWIDSVKAKGSKNAYQSLWRLWLQYCTVKSLPNNGDAQLEDMKKRRLSNDQPQEMDLRPYLNAVNDNTCERCHGEIPIGYEGSKLCLKCRLELS